MDIHMQTDMRQFFKTDLSSYMEHNRMTYIKLSFKRIGIQRCTSDTSLKVWFALFSYPAQESTTLVNPKQITLLAPPPWRMMMMMCVCVCGQASRLPPCSAHQRDLIKRGRSIAVVCGVCCVDSWLLLMQLSLLQATNSHQLPWSGTTDGPD